MGIQVLLLGVFFALLVAPIGLLAGVKSDRIILSMIIVHLVRAATVGILVTTIGLYISLFQGRLPELLSNDRFRTIVINWDLIEILPVIALCWLMTARWVTAKIQD
jgi:hypothetical protein